MLKLLAIYTIVFYIGILITRSPNYPTSTTTKGTIIGIGSRHVAKYRMYGGGEQQFPIVEYKVNGKPYRFSDETSAYILVGNIGENIKMIYDPDHPQNAAILYTFAYWMTMIDWFLYFLFLAIIAIAYLYINRDGPFA